MESRRHRSTTLAGVVIVGLLMVSVLSTCSDGSGGADGYGADGYGADGYGVEDLAPDEATTVAGAAVAGLAGLGDPYFPGAGNRGYDVSSYEVEASVTIAGPDQLDAVATITATATEDLQSFVLDLVGLEVHVVTVDGAAATTTREGRDMTVRPATPITRGLTFTVVVSYSGEPARGNDPTRTLEEGGGWLDLGDYSAVVAEPIGAATWLPSNDHPSDKAMFTIAVTVPSPLEAVSNGRLVERTDGATSSTFRWAADEPMAPYLMTLAIGDYELVDRPAVDGVTVLDAYPPDEFELGTEAFAEFPDMMQFFSAEFGAYPFSTAGNVIVPGMPPTALETQTRSVFSDEVLDDDDTTELVAHELAHQWFGDDVTPASWNDVWLNEGPAVYSQWLWSEHDGGSTVLESALESYDPDDPDLDVPPADPGVLQLFGTSVYVRSAMFLVELHERMGDGQFSTLLRTWVDRHGGADATTGQFLALADEIHGSSLADLTTPWLYGDELPELSFD